MKINQTNIFYKLTNEEYHFFEVCENLDKYEKDYFIEIAFKYFRKQGFPHYKIKDGEKITNMTKLMRFNHMTLLKENTINQSMHCLRLAWSYFPHFWEVRCGNSKYTAKEVFETDKLLKNTLDKTHNYCVKYENKKMRVSRFRQLLKKYNGVQVVSNFRPSAAKLIYDIYGGNGVVWDMSSGWGGRLLGALSCFKIKKYIGTEPSTKTYNGLLNIVKDFKYLDKKIEIHKLGSEVYKPKKNSIDLCFTSPPYFDTEKYSNEKTQSYIKYPNEDMWIKIFMKKTLKNCFYGLKNNGYLILNIANTKSAKNIEEGLILLCNKIGFKHIKTMELYLSAINGAGSKFEPVYIFRKIYE